MSNSLEIQRAILFIVKQAHKFSEASEECVQKGEYINAALAEQCESILLEVAKMLLFEAHLSDDEIELVPPGQE